MLTLRGNDEKGKFKTARAKEYPPSPNKAIAKTISEHVEDAHHFGEETEETMSHNEWCKDFEVSFDPYSADMEMHADYKRGKPKEATESGSEESWIEQSAQALKESAPAEAAEEDEQRQKDQEETRNEVEEEVSSEDALGLGKGLEATRN